jgi:23S rRNA (guanosine2251-2'-O)-methyltransferase
MNTRKRSGKRNHPGKPARNHTSEQTSSSGPKAERKQGSSNPFGGRYSAGRDSEPELKSNPSGHWLFGTHAVMAAVANPERKCSRLLVTTEVLRRLEKELRDIVPAHVPVEKSDRHGISSLLPPDSVHQGIALECEALPEPHIEDVLALYKEGPCVVVVLDQITDPHNVGAILRSAAGFGARAVIMPDRNAPPVSGTLAKSASGALELVPLIRVTNLARTLDQLARQDFWRVGLDAAAEQTLAQSNPGERTALVMGAEGSGLRRLTAEKCDQLCRLPMVEAARLTSLNVSNAAAVALYELVRA